MKYIDADKLKAEIEKRMEKHWENLPDTDSPEDDWTHNELCELGAYKELEHIESFIESLENRGNFPKSNTNSQKGIVYQAINEIMGGHTPEKLAECNQTIFKVAMRALEIQQEEHLLPKGIDEAAEKYGRNIFINECMESGICDDHDLSDAFKAGAKWQKGQDQETIELAEDHAMLAGRMQMKEEMMKDAVECVVCAGMEGNKWIMSYIGDYESIVKTCKAGDKVRIIVIKEENK